MSEIIYKKLNRLGFSTIIDFCKQYPLKTFYALSDLMGDSIAPVQILSTLRKECTEARNMNFFARDVLVRTLYHYFPEGWLGGKEFNKIKCYGSWSAALPETYDMQLDEVWHRLKNAYYNGFWGGALYPPSDAEINKFCSQF